MHRRRSTATGWSSTVEQAENAALITAISVRRGLPARAASIALATAYQESDLTNLEHGDRDSLGLFQQRPSQGWGTPEQILDPVYATNAFYDALAEVDGYESLEITEAAQEVQRSGFPRGVRRPRGRRPRPRLRAHRQLARARSAARSTTTPTGRHG